jgi:FemAB-related protein (PEP-CTERM system-associated)
MSGLRADPDVAVSAYTDRDRREWDQFVAASAEATFFHRAGWRDVVGRGFGQRTHFLVARASGSIVGILPLAEIRSRLFGHRLVSTPGCVYGGAAAATTSARTELLKTAHQLARELAVDALELRGMEADGDLAFFGGPDWRTSDLYVTFRKPLHQDSAANLKAIPRKQRAMVRKGIEIGLRSEQTMDVRRFYRIYSESVRNLGTPVFPFKYFRAITDAFAEHMEISFVVHQGRDVAAVMTFYHKGEVLPYYGGSLPVARTLKANDFMYWDLMRRSSDRGCELFDFGRSKVATGAYSFKKNWGFEPSPLHYRYCLINGDQAPDINPANPKYRLYIEAWKRLPLSIANFLGPMLSRNLG